MIAFCGVANTARPQRFGIHAEHAFYSLSDADSTIIIVGSGHVIRLHRGVASAVVPVRCLREFVQ